MATGSELTTKKLELQKLLPGRFPVILVERFQNWGMTQEMNVLSVRPKSVKEVEQVIDAMNRYNEARKGKNEPLLSIRCVGDGHSWSPLFPDDGNVLMYTSELVLEGGERIRLNEPPSKDEDITVTIVPGVTTGDLSMFFKKNNVCLKSDVILDKVTYGGVIATGCHGVGKDQKSVSDNVTGMSIVGADAKEMTYDFAGITDLDRANSLKCNLGLFGIMTSITMVVEPMVVVKTENDFSLTVEDVFYNCNTLQRLHDENWSVEIFWFPFNSLKWASLMYIGLAKVIEDWPIIPDFVLKRLVSWDPKKDKLWIRKINITNVPPEPCPTDVDYAIQDIKGLASTGFGRIVSKHLIEHPALVPSFLKVGFELVQRFNEGTRFEAINKAIHYQSFIEIMPVVDMEFAFNACSSTFSAQAEAMQVVVEKCEERYKNLQFPLSVAMEMRWIAYSDCLVCPAKAVQKEEGSGDTLYLEVLGIAGQQEEWESFTKDIADIWMKMKLNGKAPVPHWAKQWSYLNHIERHIQEAYGENLKTFRDQVTPEEKLLFSNETLDKALFKDAPKQTIPAQRRMLTKASKTESKMALMMKKVSHDDNDAKVFEEIEKTLNKHEESWKVFFRTLGEQVWNVPNFVPMMNIQSEWEFTKGLLDELGDKVKEHPKLWVDATLYQDMFM
ncbi:uncharacterized protein LOC110068020 isoform X1 [Orbicella faveolata]|uniref:uncharacterized protein LOC110068020 isoform X1 n=1 Tax=Orbicella faveolata TaxID=48498 RepID=UPI0009E3FFFB|nr:uncharacterized protein LOC110068020 isoform X1 [Orbicella faveolata]